MTWCVATLRSWRTLEIGIVSSVFVAVWAALSVYLWTDLYRHSDTTQLLTITASTARYGVPYNSIGISAIEISEQAIWFKDAQTVCNSTLLPGPESFPNGRFSHLEYHAYYFDYLLAPITWLFSTEVVIAVTQALAFSSLLLLSYVILRREGVTVLGCAVFV